jgi:hypothetical protein
VTTSEIDDISERLEALKLEQEAKNEKLAPKHKRKRK